MEFDALIKAVATVGFSTVVAIYLLWKRDKDKQEFMEAINIKDKENREFTNGRISEMRTELKEVKEESREDKKMFRDAVDTFQKSVIEFKTIGSDISYIKTEIKDVKTDLESIKSKI